jgi:DNA-binding IscR family transcriptional regulator
VAEVIRALEGPISMVQCGSDPGACDQEADCPTRVNWTRISQEVEQALERVPISEMFSSQTAGDLLTVGDVEEAAESGTS